MTTFIGQKFEELLEGLFSSKVRIKLLTLFLSEPGQRYYSRELARAIGGRQNAVWRELRNLENLGLLRSEAEGNLQYYLVNTGFPLFAELRNLVLKAAGIAVKPVIRAPLRLDKVARHEYIGPRPSERPAVYSPIVTIGETD
ncbi:MAG: winged helix-turn-helix transcriptional regulator [Chloroflexi bacterium]|nr:winged helix-turn-helix transcriptional regulator [Chloroflexota bacterium]